jgi:hypothetical protein
MEAPLTTRDEAPNPPSAKLAPTPIVNKSMHLGYSHARNVCERETFEILAQATHLLIEALKSELEAGGLVRWCALAWRKSSR